MAADARELVQLVVFGGRGELARRKLIPAFAISSCPRGSRAKSTLQ